MSLFDPSHPDYSLRRLVHQYEQSPKSIKDIPQNFIDYFGLPTLIHSLPLILPRIPKYDETAISTTMDNSNFPNISSLVKTISTFSTEIDKLYAIYYYIGHNIRYDFVAYEKRKRSNSTIEEIFKKKIAICDGFCLFYREIAKQAGIKSIEMHNFSNQPKGFEWDPVHPPAKPEFTHSAVLVIIEGQKFLSEPTWRTRYSEKSKVGEFNYNRFLFLQPLEAALNDHYPLNGSEKYLDFTYSYKDFLRANKYRGFSIQLHSESHPFSRFDCETGILDMQFSCLCPVESVALDFDWIELNRYLYTGSDIVQPSIPIAQNRCRFLTHTAFPEIGLFKIVLFVNTKGIFEYLVDNKQVSLKIPFLNYKIPFLKFLPIEPKSAMTTITNGIAFVRFIISSKRSDFWVKVTKMAKFNDWKTGQLLSTDYVCPVRLQTFDKLKHENAFTVTFPENGYYKLEICIDNSKNQTTDYIALFYEVSGASKRKPVSPLDFIPKEKQFVQIQPKNAKINPSSSVVVLKEDLMKFELTIDMNSTLNLNFREVGSDVLDYGNKPEILQKGNSSVFKFSFKLPNIGVYKLTAFVDGHFSFLQVYERRIKDRPSMNKEEEQLLINLKNTFQVKFDELADINQYYQSKKNQQPREILPQKASVSPQIPQKENTARKSTVMISPKLSVKQSIQTLSSTLKPNTSAPSQANSKTSNSIPPAANQPQRANILQTNLVSPTPTQSPSIPKANHHISPQNKIFAPAISNQTQNKNSISSTPSLLKTPPQTSIIPPSQKPTSNQSPANKDPNKHLIPSTPRSQPQSVKFTSTEKSNSPSQNQAPASSLPTSIQSTISKPSSYQQPSQTFKVTDQQNSNTSQSPTNKSPSKNLIPSTPFSQSHSQPQSVKFTSTEKSNSPSQNQASTSSLAHSIQNPNSPPPPLSQTFKVPNDQKSNILPANKSPNKNLIPSTPISQFQSTKFTPTESTNYNHPTNPAPQNPISSASDKVQKETTISTTSETSTQTPLPQSQLKKQFSSPRKSQISNLLKTDQLSQTLKPKSDLPPSSIPNSNFPSILVNSPSPRKSIFQASISRPKSVFSSNPNHSNQKALNSNQLFIVPTQSYSIENHPPPSPLVPPRLNEIHSIVQFQNFQKRNQKQSHNFSGLPNLS